MGTLREDLKNFIKYKSIPGTFGLEIEAEVLKPQDYGGLIEEKYDEVTDKINLVCSTLPSWTIKHDDSLRNYGLEYVLKQPLTFLPTLGALDEFGRVMAKVPFVQNSPSTSVHAHINMTNETPVTMANFIAIYILYENVLVEFCGPLRRSNLFALPTRVAEQTVFNVIEMFQLYSRGDPGSIRWNPETGKYASLNLCCLSSLGSLEARPFRGTTDAEEIKSWVRILNAILEFARRDFTPRDILRMYKNDDLELYYAIFGPLGVKLMGDLSPLDFTTLVERNLWYAKQIAESADWPNISKAFEASIPKTKKKKDVEKPEALIQTSEAIGATSAGLNWATFEPAFESQPPGPSGMWYASLMPTETVNGVMDNLEDYEEIYAMNTGD